uniref:CAP-Gly domain-containing protein n=1 Tax=Lotharella oceanica TaxID=641309 RepID=A0A7S2TV24_9EUKA
MASQDLEALRAQLAKLNEDLKAKEQLCVEWKNKFIAKKAELTKIMGKQKEILKPMSPEEEEKVLTDKDKQIKQLKGKLLDFKEQIKELKERKGSSSAGATPVRRTEPVRKAAERRPPRTATKKPAEVKSARSAKAASKPVERKNSSSSSARGKKATAKSDGGTITVGQKVTTVDGRRGIVRYLGKLHCAKGNWVGLELFSATGSHSGMVKGKRYFECPKKRGLMLRLDKIKEHLDAIANVDEDGVEEIEL